MSNRRCHAVRGWWRRWWSGGAASRCRVCRANSSVASDDGSCDIADLDGGLIAAAGTDRPAEKRLIECRAPTEIRNFERNVVEVECVPTRRLKRRRRRQLSFRRFLSAERLGAIRDG